MAIEVAHGLLGSFCADLRQLWTEAGGPSLRVLERQLRLSKSQVWAILNGRVRRPPDWRVLSALVECVHGYAATHGRLDRLSLRTGVEEYWRPRFALLEHAFGVGGGPAPVAALEGGPVIAPALLPSALAGFAGRREVLATLDNLLAGRSELSPAMMITTISGTAGVGKTALAVHWAHRVAGGFPDGQLYVNLRGFDPDGAALGPSAAIRRFLNALNVPEERIPVDLTDQVGLYRTLVANRRMLVVLDNACDVAQVRPLLPGHAGSVVVVTSRNQLMPLIAVEGARSLTLDLLSEEEASELLTLRLGRARTAGEAAAVDEIIRGCARLPLALAVVAARAATNPGLPLSRLATELRDRARAFDTLQVGDPTTDVRAAFSWSCQCLSPAAARLFRLLGLHPRAEFGTEVAASLAGVPPRLARTWLDELVRAHLVSEPAPDRYEFHGLLRAYAAEQVAATESAADRRAAVHRMLDHYLHTAHRATVLMEPHRYLGDAPEEIEPGVTVAEHADRTRAGAWFSTERLTLLAAVEAAAGAGFPRHAWQLARAMTSFLHTQGHLPDLTASHRTALATAERTGDLAGQAHAWRGLALAAHAAGRWRDSVIEYRAALDLFTQVADKVAMGVMHESLVCLIERTGNVGETLRHLRLALALYRSAGNQAGEARMLSTLGRSTLLLGDPAKAIRQCERALTLQQRLDDAFGQALTWHNLALAHALRRDIDEAIRCYQRSLDQFRVLGHLAGQAYALDQIGEAQRATGNLGAARIAWREAITIYDELAAPTAARLRAKLSHTQPHNHSPAA